MMMKLSNGQYLPQFGLGGFTRDSIEETNSILERGLKQGIYHFEICELFGNASLIMDYFNKKLIPRNKMYISYKIWPKGRHFKEILRSFKDSMTDCGLDYVDVLMLHAPLDSDALLDQWKGLEDLCENGYARSLGISNFSYNQVAEILKNSIISPVIFEMEVSPFRRNNEIVEFCQENSMTILTNEPFNKKLRSDYHIISKLASGLGLTSTELIIRWCLAHEFLILFPSSSEIVIPEGGFSTDNENESVVLPSEVIEIMDNLDENLLTTWLPAREEE